MSEDDKTYSSGEQAAASKPSGPVEIRPGSVLKGTYRIEAELGSGGMGTVFRATHIGLDKTMAVKILSRRAIATPDSLARFEREAKVAGKVSHPAMTDVIDFGVEQGTPYIVMEYVSGMELADLIERQGPLSPRRAVAVMRQIVSLLRAAHALGIVHRDLKPANVKIIQETPEDSQIFVKVLDFGVAKVVGDVSGQLTSEGMLVGTPAYMAPEQITGHPIDGRTDLYSAGLMFYEMLSGNRAFKGETIARILHAQLQDPPPPLTVQVPDIVRQSLAKFCEKRPEDRFQSADEADRALVACEDELRPPSGRLSLGAVVPPPVEPQDAGGKTIEYQPKKTEGAGTSGVAVPVSPERKPSSGVSVSPSLVTEGTLIREELVPSSKPEPAPVPPAPVPPAPVPAPTPAPVRTHAPPAMVAPQKTTSGASKAVVLLGVAVLLLVAGAAGVVWAWKTGRLFGGGGTGPGVVVAEPSRPTEPPKDTPPSTQTPSEPVAEQGTAPPEPTPQNDTPPTEPGTEDNPPVAEANGPQDGEPSTEEGNTPEQGQEGEPTQSPEESPPPEQEQLAPGCYAVVVAFESERGPDGRFLPWKMVSVDSRTPVSCASAPKGAINDPQGLYKHWPDSPSEKLLHSKPLNFEFPKKGEPNAQRIVMKVYTRVSGGAP